MIFDDLKKSLRENLETSCETPTWREPRTLEPYHYDFRTCAHCGGINPDDALVFIAAGCKIEGTDKFYKRYLRVPNKLHGRIVKVGSESGPLFWGKGYSWFRRLFDNHHQMPKHLGKPTIMERLRAKYSRVTYGLAPEFTSAKIYNYHFNPVQLAKYNILVDKSMKSSFGLNYEPRAYDPETFQHGGVL